MAREMGRDTIVSISSFDALKIHILSVFAGIWIVLRKSFRLLWSRTEHSIRKRDNPPMCLVDSSLGKHSYVKLRGVKLHYVECGIKNRPLLLLLHGFPDCWLSWRHQIPILAQHYRVVAVDLKGFGDSDKPMWRRSYRVPKLVSELKELITALGVSSCILVGHDIGALLGWYLVHEFPEVVEKFVSVACPHPNVYWSDLPNTSTFNTRWVQFSQLPYLPESDALKNDLNIINQCFQHLDEKNCMDSYVEAYKYTFSREEDWTGAINYYRNLPFHRISESSDNVQVPCLLVTGNKDPLVNLESVIKSTDYTEKFLVKIVDGAGHYPHQEMPDAFNKLLLSFLVVIEATPRVERVQTKGIMNRMFGAVSSTVKYGNTMLDVVQKKTINGVSSLPSKAIHLS